MRIRRALLFMPGDDRRKIEKGASLGADSIIMDLEDGVALNNKPAARDSVALALHEVDFRGTERLVRVNPASTEFQNDDLAVTLPAHPDGYVLPKVESARQVQAVAARIADAEAAHGWEPDSIRLLAIIETARGIVHLREIAESTPRLDALLFGAEDLTSDIGATRTVSGSEVAYARSALVIHAKAFGLQAIDTPFVALDDLEGLTEDTRAALGMGYTGKLAIHPRQVDLIQQIFVPTPEEIAAAKRLIDAHTAHQASQVGTFALDGKMVDMPMVRAAQTVLARAAQAGIDKT